MRDCVVNNARWLSCYNNKPELILVNEVLNRSSKIMNSDLYKKIVDIGCGEGRSINLIRKLIPYCEIDAVDINEDKIEYAKKNSIDSANYYVKDAFEYMNNNDYKQYDLILYSWSLFDMVSRFSQYEKPIKLKELLEISKRKLNKDGLIVVLQPTKGGSFEKLLSLFMPGSDEDYYMTHEALREVGFKGAEKAIPNIGELYAIWSEFTCDLNQLYNGVEAVVELETGKSLSYNEFIMYAKRFIEKQGMDINATLSFSDCVNLYYWENKDA